MNHQQKDLKERQWAVVPEDAARVIPSVGSASATSLYPRQTQLLLPEYSNSYKNRPAYVPPKTYDIIESEKIEVTITEEAQKQIDYLMSKIPNIEWSGIMVWDVVNGSLAKPKELQIEIYHIFLMDIGSGAYTEYETNPDLILDLYDEYPEAMNKRLGHMHSHHKMKAYFSGTDNQELFDNVDKHIAYLSVIVSSTSEYVGKLAVLAKTKSSNVMIDFDDKKASVKSTDQAMVVFPVCMVYSQSDYVEEISSINDRIDKINEIQKAKLSKYKHTNAGFRYGKHYHDKAYPIDYYQDYKHTPYTGSPYAQSSYITNIDSIHDLESISSYFFLSIPPYAVVGLLREMMGITQGSVIFTEVKAMDLMKVHPFTDDHIEFVDSLIEEACSKIVIPKEPILTEMLNMSGITKFVLTNKLVDSANTNLPDGETKNLMLSYFYAILLDYESTNFDGTEESSE